MGGALATAGTVVTSAGDAVISVGSCAYCKVASLFQAETSAEAVKTLKKAYAQTHQQLQQQILQLQTQVNEVRVKGEDVNRQQHLNVEQHVSKVSEANGSISSAPTGAGRGTCRVAALETAPSRRLGAWSPGRVESGRGPMSQIVVDASVEQPGRNIHFGDPSFEDVDDTMLLDPPDPVDLLIAHTHADQAVNLGARPLDFVRAKMSELKKENSKLKSRVADLEQTLSIVQTAQEWTMGKGMTQEQAARMQEIKALLEQAKKAREEMQNFSSASRAALYEKLRTCKAMLRRERQEKLEMKDASLLTSSRDKGWLRSDEGRWLRGPLVARLRPRAGTSRRLPTAEATAR
eukprot:g15871.t1